MKSSPRSSKAWVVLLKILHYFRHPRAKELYNQINVFLGITSKRADGYHDLTSLFHVISLGDTLKFLVSPSKKKDLLTINVFGIPLNDSNLVIKALNLYRKKTESDTYFWVHLDKRVPIGGGSGNATTAL
ncbi:hypothetical protein SELMODRAFT_428849 [Selaginella moellendorffii]|uniref:Uncharacterized protein n=1 Tax=Selaginella moellendorffii TaxID=88036 RepID=D8T475_SELML|nr:hypothetical protein SELMODRAFT_428849 [Selaginella moellendorffii]